MCDIVKPDAFRELFSYYDVGSMKWLEIHQVRQLYCDVRIGGISLAQVAASVKLVCGMDCVHLEDLGSLLEEMDRRYFLVQDLQWEFALLDNLHVGSISTRKAEFLLRAVHGSCFSRKRWAQFLASRPVPLAPVSFGEIEVDLCDPPTPDEDDVLHSENDVTALPASRKQDSKAPRRNYSAILTKPSVSVANKPFDEAEEVVETIVEEPPIEMTSASDNIKSSASPEVVTKHEKAQAKEVEAERQDDVVGRSEVVVSEPQRKLIDDKPKRKKEKEPKRSPESEAARSHLRDAVQSRDQQVLKPAIDNYKSVTPATQRKNDALLAQAERLLEMLKCRSALKDASARRMVNELEDAVSKARRHGFDQSPDELAQEVANAEELVVRLTRLERLRSEVLELKQSTIAELRSYKKPIPVIHHVMTATYLLLKVSEKETQKWTTIQTLLGKTGREGLKRKISQCKVTDISPDIATRARTIMGDVDLEAIRDISAGAATFFVWVDGMVNEVMADGV